MTPKDIAITAAGIAFALSAASTAWFVLMESISSVSAVSTRYADFFIDATQWLLIIGMIAGVVLSGRSPDD